MAEKKNKYRILVIKLEGKRPPEDLDIDMRIILKGVARIKLEVAGFLWLGIGTRSRLF